MTGNGGLYTSDPEGLKSYIQENETAFTHLPEDAYDMIAVMSKTKALENLKKDRHKEVEEVYDMCYAIDMLEKQSEERGIKYGITLAKSVFLLNSNGVSKDEIAQKLNISIDKVESILDDTIEGSALSSHIE